MVRGKQATTRRAPVAIDVFSGAGGLSLGLRRAGFRLIGAIEIDEMDEHGCYEQNDS